MNYADARPAIKSGDLLAWSHRGWKTWHDWQVQAVRIFTRSEYAHVGLAWRVAKRLFVLEAVSSGVRIFPLSRLLPCYWIPLGVRWSQEVEEFALAQVGLPYSKWQAILAGFGMLDKAKDDRWQCAEFAQAVLARAGIELPVDATPTALVHAAQQRGAPTWIVGRAY